MAEIVDFCAIIDEANRPPELGPWAAADILAISKGEYKPEEPTILRRVDGVCMLYPGRVHSIHGESESGKSWVALIACSQEIKQLHKVLYLDYESDANVIYHRLVLLGCMPDQLIACLTYVAPQGPPKMTDDDFARITSQKYTLAVIDGVNAALSLSNGESKDTDSITAWIMEFPRMLARKTGAAVLMIDHVNKSKESRGRFAIGSQAKMAALDGAAYVCEPIDHMAPGKVGKLSLRIAKDRPGTVRASSGAYNGQDRTQAAAIVVVDATHDGVLSVTIEAPDIDGGSEVSMNREIANAIEKAIIEKGASMSTRELRKAVGGRSETVGLTIREMVACGRLNTECHGKVTKFVTGSRFPVVPVDKMEPQ